MTDPPSPVSPAPFPGRLCEPTRCHPSTYTRPTLDLHYRPTLSTYTRPTLSTYTRPSLDLHSTYTRPTLLTYTRRRLQQTRRSWAERGRPEMTTAHLCKTSRIQQKPLASSVEQLLVITGVSLIAWANCNQAAGGR